MRVPRKEEVLAFLIGREGTRTNSLFSLNIIYHVRPYSHLGPEDRGTGGTRGDWPFKQRGCVGTGCVARERENLAYNLFFFACFNTFNCKEYKK